MPRTTPPLPPRLQRTLDGLGQKLQLARLRRNYTAELVAERAGISRATLSRAEHGDPAVALGTYARVLLALGLDGDLEVIARDDELGRKLQDLALTTPKRVRARAPKAQEP
jgi:transcriptional regulator with XRE-family HTH domain